MFLSRVYDLASFVSAEVVVGITGDCPLVDSKLVNECIKNYKNSNIISKHIVNIPCHFRLSNGDINLICNLIDEFSLKNPSQKFV